MTRFWMVAALLCAVAVGILLFPVWRQRRLRGRWSALGLAAAFAIVPIAFPLYVKVSTWDSAAQLRKKEVQVRREEGARLAAELAERLRNEDPDNVDRWRLFARTYVTLDLYAEALDAYREVLKRTPQPDNELKLDFAEAQLLADGTEAEDREAARLLDEVLVAEPNNPRALWYGGFAARESGREADVRALWSRLLQVGGAPDELVAIVREQLAALGVTVAGASAPGAAPVVGPRVLLKLSLGAGRNVAQLGPNAALFIFARAPQGGPPVAVMRQPATAVPGEFTLSDANSMIAGRSLGDFEELTLVARLSASGQPTESPGDWYAQTTFRPKEGGAVALVIDRVVQ